MTVHDPKRFYIAGPMTGIEDWNYPEFNRVAALYRTWGHEVFNPTENFGGNPNAAGGKPAYMRLDFAAVLTVDALVLLPGWETSIGAQAEVRMAEQLNLELWGTDGNYWGANAYSYDQLPWNMPTHTPPVSQRFTTSSDGVVAPRAGHPMFYQLTAKMGDVHEDKNQDYADTSDPFKNFRNSDIGITDVQSVVSRMGDKWARVKKIARGEELSVKDETVEDTFIDLANLSLIALIVHKESRGTA